MSDEDFTFTGSLISGPDVDLVELAGLQLTDEEQERLWDQTTPRRVLVDYLLVEEFEIRAIEGGPGNSDSFYEYRCGDKDAFLKRLREVLLKFARG